MKHTILSVDPGSIAQQLGIRAGDMLLSINGEIVRDLIDYQALCANKRIRLEIERNAEPTEFIFAKEEYEPIGLSFAKDLMSGMRCCANHCVFCFEDQNPPGVRPTLSSRDDDWRLSLMTGSYVTLTNVPQRELERIVKRHASPLYISVHATDPQLRCMLLQNERAGSILQQLKTLADGGIRFHTQAVVCPGLNDGEALEKTIHDIVALAPAALSLAVVPVGLTCHREGRYPLHTYTKEEARQTLDICHKWRKICRQYIDTAFVYPADELYLIAEMDLPSDADYEGFELIENGVGMLRLFETEYALAYDDAKAYNELPTIAATAPSVCIATGTAAATWIAKVLHDRPIPGANIRVQAVPNHFFGSTVTVAGLLTGHDLLYPQTGIASAPEDEIWISDCMLKEGEPILLDDMPLRQLEEQLQKPVRVIRRNGEALFEAICSLGE